MGGNTLKISPIQTQLQESPRRNNSTATLLFTYFLYVDGQLEISQGKQHKNPLLPDKMVAEFPSPIGTRKIEMCLFN